MLHGLLSRVCAPDVCSNAGTIKFCKIGLGIFRFVNIEPSGVRLAGLNWYYPLDTKPLANRICEAQLLNLFRLVENSRVNDSTRDVMRGGGEVGENPHQDMVSREP